MHFEGFVIGGRVTVPFCGSLLEKQEPLSLMR